MRVDGCATCWGFYLSPAHADDAVDAAVCIIEEGHGDRMFASRQPVAFGGRVDLKDVSSGAEDGLFPSKQKKQEKQMNHCEAAADSVTYKN